VNTPSIDFGIVHKGDAVGLQSISVTNAAAVTALNDVLQGSVTGTTGAPFSGTSNLGLGLAAGTSDIGSLQVGLNTSTAGEFNVTLFLEGNVISSAGNVPEPGTLALLAIGGLAGAWRRQRSL